MVYSFIYEVLVGTDWKKLGESIRDFFVKGLKATDFTLIGKTIAAKINASFKFFKEIVADKSFWESVGNSIVNGINGFISEIDVKNAAQTLAGIINGIASVIKQLIAEINWKEATSKLTEGLKEMFSSVDPSVISLGIVMLFVKAFADIGSIILGLFASTFSGGVFDVLIGNVFFDNLRDDILNKGKDFTVGNIFTTIGEKIGKGFKTIGSKVGGDINNFLGNIFSIFDKNSERYYKSGEKYFKFTKKILMPI